jgi:hypothetical protein
MAGRGTRLLLLVAALRHAAGYIYNYDISAPVEVPTNPYGVIFSEGPMYASGELVPNGVSSIRVTFEAETTTGSADVDETNSTLAVFLNTVFLGPDLDSSMVLPCCNATQVAAGSCDAADLGLAVLQAAVPEGSYAISTVPLILGNDSEVRIARHSRCDVRLPFRLPIERILDARRSSTATRASS